jgi:hypothetical protein
LHSQPFTNTHLHFFITVESATSQVLPQRPKQMEVRRGKVRTIGWMVQKVSAKRLHQLLCPKCAVWGRIVVLKDHTSRQISRSLPANRLTQSSQCVAVGVCVDCCAPRDEFNVDDSFCIPEYRCHNFSSRLTHFEFFGSRISWVFSLHSNLFYLRSEVVHLCLIACHYGFQELAFIFFKPLKM